VLQADGGTRHDRDHRRVHRAGRRRRPCAGRGASRGSDLGAVAAVSVGIVSRRSRCSISTTPKTPTATPT
jgi:hypothetical protein